VAGATLLCDRYVSIITRPVVGLVTGDTARILLEVAAHHPGERGGARVAESGDAPARRQEAGSAVAVRHGVAVLADAEPSRLRKGQPGTQRGDADDDAMTRQLLLIYDRHP